MRSIFLLAFILLVSVTAGLSITKKPTMKPSPPTYQSIRNPVEPITFNTSYKYPTLP
jgi:hypothetical protein